MKDTAALVILGLALIITNIEWAVNYTQLQKEDKRLLEWNHTVETKMDCTWRK